MAITLIEKHDSRSANVGVDDPAIDLAYWVKGSDDDAAIRAAVQSSVPAYHAGLPFQNCHIKPLGNQLWEAVARYGKKEPKETGQSSFSFDTGGGSQHISQSLATIGSHAPPGKTAPDFKGAIGCTTDAVEGTDITVPVYSFTETHYLPIATVTAAYKAALFRLTGRTNDDTFRGFEAGEVLFLGASGSQRGYEDWEVTFRFAASPNVTGLAVGDITDIDKRGWEYLWVRYADAESEDVLVKQPIAVYVEQVYEEGDYAHLAIGS